MKDFKYFTENSIQHISLHDCCCKKCIGIVCLLFLKWSGWKYSLYTWIINLIKHINQGLLIKGDKEIPISKSMEIENFEILDFNETFKEAGFELSLFGCNVSEPAVDFIKINISYSTSHVMFNELCDISWFETIWNIQYK